MLHRSQQLVILLVLLLSTAGCNHQQKDFEKFEQSYLYDDMFVDMLPTITEITSEIGNEIQETDYTIFHKYGGHIDYDRSKSPWVLNANIPVLGSKGTGKLAIFDAETEKGGLWTVGWITFTPDNSQDVVVISSPGGAEDKEPPTYDFE